MPCDLLPCLLYGPARYLPVWRRSRSLLEYLPIPDSAFTRIARQLEILRQFKRVDRTGIFTEPTEHAAREVVGKRRQFLPPSLLVPQAAYHNQVFRTRQRAKIAGDAESFVCVRVEIEPRRAPIALSYSGSLRGVLLGVDVPWILMPERDPHPLQQIHQQDLL